MLYPCPRYRDGTPAVSQTDDQQLMHKTNPVPIHNQHYLLNMASLTCQLASGDRFIPGMNTNRWIVQKPAQALDKAEQLRFSRYLPSDPAEVNRTTLMNSNNQPGEIPDAGYSFGRLQLSNFHKPSMIELVDRHGILPFFACTNYRSTFIVPINPFY
jgi:hypothetical protein